MTHLFKRTLTWLLVVALVIGVFPMIAFAANDPASQPVLMTDTLDLDDPASMQFLGTNPVEEKTDATNGTYYVLSGGGTNIYNKVATRKTYSGNLTLSYQVQFKNEASTEMMFAAIRGTDFSDSSKHFPNAITNNFVLHTTGSGIRVSRTNASGGNDASASSDKTMSNNYNNQKTVFGKDACCKGVPGKAYKI